MVLILLLLIEKKQGVEFVLILHVCLHAERWHFKPFLNINFPFYSKQYRMHSVNASISL